MTHLNTASPGCLRVILGSHGNMPCHIFDDQGNDLMPVLRPFRISIEAEAGGMTKVTLLVHGAELEVEADAQHVIGKTGDD